ncbi:hypothetical protein NDU88_000971 [Pleurodeles waltl]|uniref:Uncharacterized protein n=1 Tax=Pleurodeles waltl TaxID=8319 RepID=A0AAV7Q2Y1_PLEWA|nr:hypothetical protein NDU88_000971 [Pleurodeles waltl]
MTPSVCPGGGVLCYLPRARCPDGWRRGAPRLVWDWPADGRAARWAVGQRSVLADTITVQGSVPGGTSARRHSVSGGPGAKILAALCCLRPSGQPCQVNVGEAGSRAV